MLSRLIKDNLPYRSASVLKNKRVVFNIKGNDYRLIVAIAYKLGYEAKHYPIGLPDPIEAIKFRMEQAGLTAKDLIPMIGQRNRVYEILNRKRALTLPMIWKLHQQLGIPAESLIKPTLRHIKPRISS